MNPLFAILDWGDYGIIAVIVSCFSFGASMATRSDVNIVLLEKQLRVLQIKMDALLKHHGIELPNPPPSGLSAKVELLASDPNTRIAAIKLYREENPGTGLAEAKVAIETYYKKLPR
jgi:ribosomal protein L7/L12